jgi:hypothetical protein
MRPNSTQVEGVSPLESSDAVDRRDARKAQFSVNKAERGIDISPLPMFNVLSPQSAAFARIHPSRTGDRPVDSHINRVGGAWGKPASRPRPSRLRNHSFMYWSHLGRMTLSEKPSAFRGRALDCLR